MDPELADYLDRRFAEFGQQLDSRFAAHDARFTTVDAKLAEHDARFTTVDAKLAEHDARFTTVDAKLAEHPGSRPSTPSWPSTTRSSPGSTRRLRKPPPRHGATSTSSPKR